MKICIARVQCHLERPWQPGQHTGATLGTTVRGAFKSAFLRVGCLRAAACGVCAGVEKDSSRCGDSSRCAVPRIYPPWSASLGRNPSPAIRRWPRVRGPQDLEVSVVLWGERACEHSKVVWRAFDEMGHVGLRDSRGKVRHRSEVAELFSGALHDWLAHDAGRVGIVGKQDLAFELAEPSTGDERQPPTAASVLSALAQDLALWRLEESGRSAFMAKYEGADAVAENAGRVASSTLNGVRVQPMDLRWVVVGDRYSTGNGRAIHLAGWKGFFRLRGDLTTALPWLQTLALRGAGGRTDFGLGEVRIWRPLD